MWTTVCVEIFSLSKNRDDTVRGIFGCRRTFSFRRIFGFRCIFGFRRIFGFWRILSVRRIFGFRCIFGVGSIFGLRIWRCLIVRHHAKTPRVFELHSAVKSVKHKNHKNLDSCLRLTHFYLVDSSCQYVCLEKTLPV